MSVRNKLAFPTNSTVGMTYREWLIGQIICGLQSNPEIRKENWSYDEYATAAMAQAEELIRKMEEKV